MNSRFAFAQNANYPISQLGNCRDARECYFYCRIPENTPACWSYDKYVVNNNILGEETVNVTYPISELGNCSSANECFIFCNQPQNQKTCYDFAKSRGLIKEKPKLENIIELAKKELGCQNDLECMVFCQQPDNMDACRAFAQKYGLVKETPDTHRKPPPPAVLQKAKDELGCSNEGECMNLCNNPENRDKCFKFAKDNNLIPEEEIQKHEEFSKKEKALLEDSKSELGCDSPQSCMPICEKPENRAKCDSLGRKHGMGPPNPPQGSPRQLISGPGGCANEKECKMYCEKNPDDCKGFQSPPTSGNANFNNPPNEPPNRPPIPNNSKEGDFLGPGGCKTEQECKAFCEKHPSECPGFPNHKSGPSQNPGQSNNPATNQQFNSPPPNKNPNPNPNMFNQNFNPPRHDDGQNTAIINPPKPIDDKNN